MNSSSRTRTYNLAVNRNGWGARRKARKSFVFSILAKSWVFASLRIQTRFFARYRGIDIAKRYKTVAQRRPILRSLGGWLSEVEWPRSLVMRSRGKCNWLRLHMTNGLGIRRLRGDLRIIRGLITLVLRGARATGLSATCQTKR